MAMHKSDPSPTSKFRCVPEQAHTLPCCVSANQFIKNSTGSWVVIRMCPSGSELARRVAKPHCAPSHNYALSPPEDLLLRFALRVKDPAVWLGRGTGPMPALEESVARIHGDIAEFVPPPSAPGDSKCRISVGIVASNPWPPSARNAIRLGSLFPTQPEGAPEDPLSSHRIK